MNHGLGAVNSTVRSDLKRTNTFYASSRGFFGRESQESFVMDHYVIFPLYEEDGLVHILQVDEGLITQSERSLMELMLTKVIVQQNTLEKDYG